jgi:hypothetical protein
MEILVEALKVVDLTVIHLQPQDQGGFKGRSTKSEDSSDLENAFSP